MLLTLVVPPSMLSRSLWLTTEILIGTTADLLGRERRLDIIRNQSRADMHRPSKSNQKGEERETSATNTAARREARRQPNPIYSEVSPAPASEHSEEMKGLLLARTTRNPTMTADVKGKQAHASGSERAHTDVRVRPD